ncbi:transcriptional regulator ctsr [hydrocarbon metagenome]|uniref:Transcriptional regulator ctsr n=1 Tax=hydrocarbon metagenome TaxID=938273 RepID=A0A0W8E9T9_9ZZZZ
MKRSLADRIEQYIKVLIDRSAEKQIEIQRAELAETFSCVPSQVTYVIATRFQEKYGYLTESRRGGKGFVRITRFTISSDICTIFEGDRLFDFINELMEKKMLDSKEGNMLKHIVLSAGNDLADEERKHLYNSVARALSEYLNLN